MYRFATQYVVISFLYIVGVVASNNAFAQDLPNEKLEQIREIVTGDAEPVYQHMVGSNIFSLITQSLNLRTQHAFTPSLAWVVSGEYRWPRGYLDLGFSTFSLEAGVTWYPAQRMMHGFFLEPKLGVSALLIENDGGLMWLPNISGLFGYSWVFARAIQLNLGIGVQYAYNGGTILQTIPGDSRHSVWPTGQFSLGYVF